jgi:hypothetical protein
LPAGGRDNLSSVIEAVRSGVALRRCWIECDDRMAGTVAALRAMEGVER